MKLLIANRGEIAVRIIRTCRDMGLSPVAVYSEADRQALHVKMADEAFEIGPASSRDSYLSIERLCEAIERSGADLVHPGYGFLAENPEFAEACQACGAVFVGPSPEAIRIMGDKTAARSAMIRAGVPVIPGSDGPVESLEEALGAARLIGFPVMLKASAGGGGKGMRLCRDEDQLRSSFEAARSEAESAFGDASVFLERRLLRPRHIEVQVLGDRHGRLLHLGERECSIQRRHQKVVEECPSPLVDADMRRHLGEYALKASAAVSYYGAGTIEMLIDTAPDASEQEFFFLEMNTRLQVEHPVTESVTGLDLVEEQIRVALGEKLRLEQEEIRLNGAALEFRIYAEDPFNQFLPSPGRVGSLVEPSGPGVRVDSGVAAESEIPIHYDPLISKLITFGRDREQAIARMRRAVAEYRIGGVRTNLPFFSVLLEEEKFQAGDLSTDFIERHDLLSRLDSDEDLPDAVLAGAALELFQREERKRIRPAAGSRTSNWRDLGRFEGRL